MVQTSLSKFRSVQGANTRDTANRHHSGVSVDDDQDIDTLLQSKENGDNNNEKYYCRHKLSRSVKHVSELGARFELPVSLFRLLFFCRSF